MSNSHNEITPNRVGIWPWLALLLGVMVGSMIGFALRPAEITGAAPWEMHRTHKEQYLDLVGELYALDGNAERVSNLLRGWRPEDVAAILAEMEASSNDPAEIARLTALRDVARIPATEPTFTQLLRNEPLILISLGATGIVLLIAGAVGLLVSTEQERLSRILAQAIQERAQAYPQPAANQPPPDLRALTDAINKTNNAKLGKLLQAAETARKTDAEQQPAPQPAAAARPQRADDPPEQTSNDSHPAHAQSELLHPPAPFQPAAPEAPQFDENDLDLPPQMPRPLPAHLSHFQDAEADLSEPGYGPPRVEPDPPNQGDSGPFDLPQPNSDLARLLADESPRDAADKPTRTQPVEQRQQPPQIQQALIETPRPSPAQPPTVNQFDVQQTRRPLPPIAQAPPPPQQRAAPQFDYETPPVRQPAPPSPSEQPPVVQQPPPPVIQQTIPQPPPRRAPPPPPPPRAEPASIGMEEVDSKAKIGEILADVFVDEGLLQKQALLHGLVPVDVHNLVNRAVYLKQQLQEKTAAPSS